MKNGRCLWKTCDWVSKVGLEFKEKTYFWLLSILFIATALGMDELSMEDSAQKGVDNQGHIQNHTGFLPKTMSSTHRLCILI